MSGDLSRCRLVWSAAKLSRRGRKQTFSLTPRTFSEIRGLSHDLPGISGQLGFTPVYAATAYPTLGPFVVPDDAEPFDLSFTEYDHPAVRIFQKQRALSPAEWATLFATAVRQPSVATRAAP